MAQTGFTPIQIYSSSTAAAAPAAGNLTNSTLGSELAINITDGKLFYKDNAGVVQVIGWKTVPTSAGGTGLTSYTAGDLIYYASGTAFTKLAIGSAYQQLGVNAGGTAPAWQPSSTSTLTAQGDLLYASAANTLARLAKNTTATRYLSNTGASNNPAWAQIDLTNGVTGTLPVGNGGTGTATAFTAGSIVFAGASGVFSQNNAAFFWDNTNSRLGVGTNSPAVKGHFSGGVRVADSANSANYITIGSGTEAPYGNNSVVAQTGSLSIGTVAASTNIILLQNGAEAARVDTSKNLAVGTTATTYGRIQSKASALTSPSFLAEQSSANGCVLYADAYYQDMNLMSIGLEYSSGGLMLGSCVKPKTTNTGFISSESLFSTYGAAIVVDGSASPFKVYGSDTSSTIAVNSDRALSLRMQVTQPGHTAPGADNTYNIGTAALRWANVYAANGTINTSDAREKTPVDAMTANEINAAKQLAKEIGTFKFLSAIAKKGDQARTHIGLTVQRAIEIMVDNSLDPMKYGFICYDKWDDQYDHYPAIKAQDAVLDDQGNVIKAAVPAREEQNIKTIDAGDHYGFRFEELLLFVAKGFEERLSALESK
jgi:hypothetical protein